MKNDIEQRIILLQTLPLFQGLSHEDLRFLAGESTSHVFDVGETIFYQGDQGHTCHIVIKGKLRVYVVGEDGRELSVNISRPGEIIGEMALFEDLPRSANVEAIEKAHTLEIHQKALLHGLQRSPTLALSLLRALSSRLRNTTEKAEGLASMTVTNRLWARLQHLARWAGKPAVGGGTQLTLTMTQQELAALVGTSRESVNRALSRLRRQNKIRLQDGWIILIDDSAV